MVFIPTKITTLAGRSHRRSHAVTPLSIFCASHLSGAPNTTALWIDGEVGTAECTAQDEPGFVNGVVNNHDDDDNPNGLKTNNECIRWAFFQ